jgi:hypothetical protein
LPANLQLPDSNPRSPSFQDPHSLYAPRNSASGPSPDIPPLPGSSKLENQNRSSKVPSLCHSDKSEMTFHSSIPQPSAVPNTQPSGIIPKEDLEPEVCNGSTPGPLENDELSSDVLWNSPELPEYWSSDMWSSPL